MALVNRSLMLDITPGAIPKVVNVSEYDQNRQFTISLVDDGGVFEIPSGTTATVEGTIGNTGFSESATVSGDTITFTLSESMTAKAGDVWAKIKLVKDSKPIQTCAFILRCDRAGVEAETVVSDPGFGEQVAEAVEHYIDTEGIGAVRYDQAQSYMTDAEKILACDNIGAATNARLDGVAESTGIHPIHMVAGRINTAGDTVDVSAVTASAGWKHAVVDCVAGDMFTITATGASSYRPYCFLDADGNVLVKPITLSFDGVLRFAPVGAAKLVINDSGNNTSYRGEYIENRLETALENVISKNGDNLLAIADFSFARYGMDFRAISNKNILMVNGTANGALTVNCLTGRSENPADAPGAWGSETIPWLVVGKSYRLVWRLLSGSWTYTGNTPPAFTVRNSAGNTMLGNLRGIVTLQEAASYVQFFAGDTTVFDNCVFEVSIVETDTDELYEQSFASMALPGSVKVPALNALIDDLSYTIPAEVTTTGNFVDTGGYAEGGCTDGDEMLYYVQHHSDYGSGGSIDDDRSTRTFVKASADGTVLASRAATWAGDGVHYIHSNGMCYNPTTDEVLVIPLDPTGNNAVHFLDGDTLAYKRTVNFGDSLREYAPDMTYFTSVAWDSTKQLYVFLLAGNSGYTNPADATAQKRLRGFAFYDKDFNFVKCTRFDRLLTIPGYNDFNVSSTIFGGVYTDADYIYTTVHKTGDDVVAVFDWDGLLVGTFSAAFGNELEWMGRLGDGTWVFGYGSTVSGTSRVTVYKAVTTKKRQVLKETVRSQFKPFRESF